MPTWAWIILIVIAVIVLFIASTYNQLVVLRNKVRDQWAQIEVVLKRRADLIPNLVETVKGYAGHEKETLEAVITARNKAVSATNPKEEMEANGELTKALGRFFALSEAYPDLKANTNFMDLQNQLKDTEDKITYSRQFYNDVVLKYNNACQQFPSSWLAKAFGFKAEEYFQAPEAERAVPKVEF